MEIPDFPTKLHPVMSKALDLSVESRKDWLRERLSLSLSA